MKSCVIALKSSLIFVCMYKIISLSSNKFIQKLYNVFGFYVFIEINDGTRVLLYRIVNQSCQFNEQGTIHYVLCNLIN